MKTKFIKIGNSYGIRIPKALIHESGLRNEVELVVSEGQIVIKPIKTNRESWDTAFRKMAEKQDDGLIDKELIHGDSHWEEKEWDWKEVSE